MVTRHLLARGLKHGAAAYARTMCRPLGWSLLVAVAAVVAGASVSPAPAGACSIGVPDAKVTFVGRATEVDERSQLVLFVAAEVDSTWTFDPGPRREPLQPVRFPAAGDVISVQYSSANDDIQILDIGESYRVEAWAWGERPLRWTSTSRDFFDFSNGGCGKDVTPAWTTHPDGRPIESPIQNFIRRTRRGGYRVQVALLGSGVAVVAGVGTARLIRRRRRAADPAGLRDASD